MESEAVRKARAARQASYALANADTTVKNKALSYIADDLLAHAGDIMDANAADVAAAREKGMSDAMIDRLTLTQDRIQGIAEGVRQVIALPDPVGQTLSSWDRPNGLHIDKVTVPLGVIAIIFESRPNVTVDAAVLCLKSGNATVLRGGSEAIRSNVALAGVIRHAIARAGLPSDAVTIMENTDRALVSELLTLRQYINLAIPRGGAGLIRMVVDTAKVPVIETGSGVCHVYVDKDADLDMAVRIIENAKVSRPSTCNAMETLLVHKDVVRPLMEKLVPVLKARHVEMRADTAAREAGGDDTIGAASEEDWRTEYNALIMSIRTVALSMKRWIISAATAHTIRNLSLRKIRRRRNGSCRKSIRLPSMSMLRRDLRTALNLALVQKSASVRKSCMPVVRWDWKRWSAINI